MLCNYTCRVKESLGKDELGVWLYGTAADKTGVVGKPS